MLIRSRSDMAESTSQFTDEHLLVEPPIVDSLRADLTRNEWVITFIPEDSVSRREKEQVAIGFSTPEGRRIQLRINRLNKLLGGQIERLSHAGDGSFTFHLRDG